MSERELAYAYVDELERWRRIEAAARDLLPTLEAYEEDIDLDDLRLALRTSDEVKIEDGETPVSRTLNDEPRTEAGRRLLARESAPSVKDYPSLYQPGMRNRYPLEVQAQHQREAYSHLREVLGQMVGHIALRELGADYVTIPDDWSDEMVEAYATARELAFPNSTTVLHR